MPTNQEPLSKQLAKGILLAYPRRSKQVVVYKQRNNHAPEWLNANAIGGGASTELLTVLPAEFDTELCSQKQKAANDQ
jgi:hypothetical protein